MLFVLDTKMLEYFYQFPSILFKRCSRGAGISETVMPVDVDRKSSKTHILSGSHAVFSAVVKATIAMLGRQGCVSPYRVLRHTVWIAGHLPPRVE
jgi:hypothetical protein